VGAWKIQWYMGGKYQDGSYENVAIRGG
jgi:hypothetical protein